MTHSEDEGVLVAVLLLVGYASNVRGKIGVGSP